MDFFVQTYHASIMFESLPGDGWYYIFSLKHLDILLTRCLVRICGHKLFINIYIYIYIYIYINNLYYHKLLFMFLKYLNQTMYYLFMTKISSKIFINNLCLHIIIYIHYCVYIFWKLSSIIFFFFEKSLYTLHSLIIKIWINWIKVYVSTNHT